MQVKQSTSPFIDLVDNYNQSTKYNFRTYPNDIVTGYTMSNLSKILFQNLMVYQVLKVN